MTGASGASSAAAARMNRGNLLHVDTQLWRLAQCAIHHLIVTDLLPFPQSCGTDIKKETPPPPRRTKTRRSKAAGAPTAGDSILRRARRHETAPQIPSSRRASRAIASRLHADAPVRGRGLAPSRGRDYSSFGNPDETAQKCARALSGAIAGPVLPIVKKTQPSCSRQPMLIHPPCRLYFRAFSIKFCRIRLIYGSSP